jgi:hypothetical protein
LSQRKKIKRTKNEFLLLLFFGLAATTKSPQKKKIGSPTNQNLHTTKKIRLFTFAEPERQKFT